MFNTSDEVLVFVDEIISFPSDLNLEYGFENTTIEWQLSNQNFTKINCSPTTFPKKATVLFNPENGGWAPGKKVSSMPV